MSTKPKILVRLEYEEAAEAYLRGLPLEHFMEGKAQARQRQVTVDSFTLLRRRRPDVLIYSEMLIQYPHRRTRKIRQVVPDNMAVLHAGDLDAESSFNLPLQPCGPFWVFEYVSKHNKRKDYEDSFEKYERELKVPYYLIFYPDNQELSLYRHGGRKYVSVKPDARERYAVPELEMELALVEGWVRYWYRGELLRLPEEVEASEEAALRQIEEERRARRALEEEVARLRGETKAARGRAGNGR